jgi:hypothetical protein
MILKLKSSRLSDIVYLSYFDLSYIQWASDIVYLCYFNLSCIQWASGIVYLTLDQGYKKIRLIRSLKKFIFRYQYLVEIYSVSAEKIISDAFSYSENV